MVAMAKSTRSSRRLWWLVVVLMVLINVVAWQRKPIAGWLGQLAIARAGSDPTRSRQYITLAGWVSSDAPEIALARARLHRHEADLDAFRRDLKRARHLGIAPERADRERWMALAQSGQMGIAGPQLVNLLETGGGEEAEICEAFALGFKRISSNHRLALNLAKRNASKAGSKVTSEPFGLRFPTMNSIG